MQNITKATSFRTSGTIPASRSLCIGLLLLSLLIHQGSATILYANGSIEDYRRWGTYSQLTTGRVFRQSVVPNWFGDKDDPKLWYQLQTGSSTHEFVLVDPVAKKRQPAFDHSKLAEALSERTKSQVQAKAIKIRALGFSGDMSKIQFKFDEQDWQFELPSGPLTRTDESRDGGIVGDQIKARNSVARSVSSQRNSQIEFQNQTKESLNVYWVNQAGRRLPYGKVMPGKTKLQNSFVGHAWVLTKDRARDVAAFVVEARRKLAVITESTPQPSPKSGRNSKKVRGQRGSSNSPNGKWVITFEDGRPVLRSSRNAANSNDKTDGTSIQFTGDFDASNSFATRAWWSPDSNFFVLMEVEDAKERQVAMVESSPQDSIHGKLKKITYVKPGDKIDIRRPVLFNVNTGKAIKIDNKSFSNPYDTTDVHWDSSSQSFSFLYNQRGHQALRLITVDAKTGKAVVTIDEQSETFICYSNKKFLRRLDETNEIIWMSERSGWNHLYLIDQQSGEVKNAITSGDWAVRGVDRVDEQNRQLYLKVSGIDPDQDPYHLHLVRVDFDGKNLTRLTRGDGNHDWRFSPEGRYLIDTYSRVDLPAVTELRRADTGELVCDLERGDASDLLATGWQFPERFVAKGRDGETDIHGVIVRPTNFDASKRYPVLEDIYAGPHSAFAPKDFGLHRRMFQMAELGFVVVKMDGMGTNHRSKAFHDVCWRNLGDSGFPDRIAWIKAAAKNRPEMDLDRVGIWGGSAGGQSAMRALIAHGDFYKAAAADCGCHDNRVDKI